MCPGQASAKLQSQLGALTTDKAAGSTETFRPETKDAKDAVHKGGQDGKTVHKTPSAAKSKAQPKVPPAPVPDPGPLPPESEAAKQARLRRICERKPSGRMNVPDHIHQRWKNGTKADRAELLEQLEAADWDKDCRKVSSWCVENLEAAIAVLETEYQACECIKASVAKKTLLRSLKKQVEE
eukprot:s532_g14.t1